MTLRIYNSLTRQKETFEPIEEGKVRMYVCGVTVYDSAHIGHAMSSLVFDTIRRYLEHRGYQVKYIQNFTDIDDKIIARAQALGISPHELADKYAREFLQEMKALNVKEADLYPRATAEIPTIIQIIEGLIEKGYAYPSDGNVYFRVQKYREYGKLSNRTLEGAQPGESINGKEHPMDFALWKAAKPGEPAWPSPWGEGRPGWHIECSAMNLHHLGEQIDIHGGGMDLVFPHHENEIAQTEAYTGKPFAKYWVHNGLLKLGEEKMSKSLGNLITIKEFLEHHDPQSLRLFVLLSGYRRPVTFTEESINAAERGLERLRSALRPAKTTSNTEADPAAVQALNAQVEKTRKGFYEAMDDDFSTPQALAHIFDLVKAINSARDAGVSGEPFEQAQQTLLTLTSVLGFDLARGPEAGDVEARPFIELLINVRNELRAARQWDLADKIRDELAALGVILEDTPAGTEWRMA
ncbi:MAG: cysteine--tRNA ligase [Chloroflexi bacterium]|nr:MAG: cysteine--tRNA ligase [Chloroflexota bacterium]